MKPSARRPPWRSKDTCNGFNRAWVTIFDSHVTLFLSGLVLFAVATDEVRGFAVTLIIGMIWNLFYRRLRLAGDLPEFWYDMGWLKEDHHVLQVCWTRPTSTSSAPASTA